MTSSILSKIRSKREFSQLPEKDIEIAFSHFEKRQASEEEKIKITKELLRKLFSAFVSPKLLSLKNKEPEWILRKHISTRERLPYYEEIYKKIFGKEKNASVIDLGAGINGFSFKFFGKNVNYTAIESVGQLVELMNYYFKEKKIQGEAVHLSLFEKEKVKKIIEKTKKPRIIFLFKVIDALESLKADYSKELIKEIVPLADKVVVSFATRSLGNRQKFKAKRNWILDFIKENFDVLDDFEVEGERYILFNKGVSF
ncbi:hypothetical protein M0R19_00065 [Candidatus Pacearchaeota archaeon]|jgi:hypothetical protein|nr:hypothetical protein [Candidatus Pacearchaeota archaeon]